MSPIVATMFGLHILSSHYTGGEFPFLIPATEPGIYTAMFKVMDPTDGSTATANVHYNRGSKPLFVT